MTPEQQRIAIAKACGWRNTPFGEPIERHPKTWRSLGDLPDYPNDLNAMHEAEKKLTHDQQIQFSVELGKLTTSHFPASRSAWMDFTIAHATAAQRAEAFLRTLNLWKE